MYLRIFLCNVKFLKFSVIILVSSDQDECHIVRRISYLRATANDRMNIESDLSEEDDVSDASR